MPRRACRSTCSRAVFPCPDTQSLAVHGEDHAQTFTVSCEVPGLGLQTQGEGSSRRRAEQEAAERMLGAIHKQKVPDRS